MISLIKEDDNAVQGEHHLSILTEFICRDLFQSDPSTKEKCLTLLGTVLHSKHCATSLTPTQCTQITDALCTIINNNDINIITASNSTIRKLAVWCIEVQSLPPERLSAKIVDSICKYALGSSTQVTESIEYEALGALDKLLFHTDHLHLESTPDLWAPPIWQRAISPSPQLRSRAYSILCTLSQDSAHLSDKLSKLLYTALDESLLSEYSSFISECQEKTYPVRLWGVFASLLGNRVLCGRTAQQFLRFQEGFFAHPAGEVRATAFDSWKAPLRLFAHLQEKKKHQKLFGLFYKPFLFVIEKRVDEQPSPALVIDAALRTWKAFVPSLNREMLVDKFDVLFTRFGFKIADLNSAHSCTVLEVLNGAVTLCNDLLTNISTDTDNNSNCDDILSGRIKRIADLIKSTLECEEQQDTQAVHKLCIDTFKTVANALDDNVDGIKLFTEETLLNNTSLTTSYNTKFALDLFSQAVTPAKKSPKLATSLALKLLQMPTFTSGDAQSERKTLNRALETFELFVEAAAASTSPEELASVVTQIEESTLSAALVQELWSAMCTQVKARPLSCDMSADFCAGLLGMAFAFAGSGNEAETKCAEGDWDIMMAHFAGIPGLCEPLCTKMIQVCENVQVIPGRARFLASAFRSFVTHFGWDAGEVKIGCAFVLATKLLRIAHAAVHDLGNAGWVKSVLETVGLLIKECSKELSEVVSTQDFSKVLGLWANEPLPQSTGKESDDDAVASVKEGMITLLESFLCATKSFFSFGKRVDLTILLCDMDEPLAECLRSKHRRVKNAAVDTWNATFGANEKENFGYSPLVHSALTDLKRARTCLTLPCWKDRTTLISSPIKRSNSIENNIIIRVSKQLNDFNAEEENLQKPPSQKKVKMTVESNNNEKENKSLKPAEEELRSSQKHTSVVDNDDKETLSFGDVVEKDLCCSFSSAIDDFLQAGRRILNDPQAFANPDNGYTKEILQMALQVANKAFEELK